MYVHIFKMLGLGNQKLVLTTKPSKHSGMRQANDEKPVTNCLQMDQTSSYYLDQSGPLCSTGSCFTFQQMPAAGPLPDRPPAPRAPSELACKHLCLSFRSSGSKSNAFTPNDFKRRLACLELYKVQSLRGQSICGHVWYEIVWDGLSNTPLAVPGGWWDAWFWNNPQGQVPMCTSTNQDL